MSYPKRNELRLPGADVLTKKQRSYCMSRIRGGDTQAEVRLRKECWALGLRYRLGSKLLGRPDLEFPSARIAVFVDGCFWHGCPVHYKAPSTRAEFWKRKLEANQRRDVFVNETLFVKGWTVVRIWEHSLKTDDMRRDAALYIKRRVRSALS